VDLFHFDLDWVVGYGRLLVVCLLDWQFGEGGVEVEWGLGERVMMVVVVVLTVEVGEFVGGFVDVFVVVFVVGLSGLGESRNGFFGEDMVTGKEEQESRNEMSVRENDFPVSSVLFALIAHSISSPHFLGDYSAIAFTNAVSSPRPSRRHSAIDKTSMSPLDQRLKQHYCPPY
jgi:hypothetical protein